MDADLVGRKKHRFPNLVCMKLSGYHKDKGDKVTLLTDYSSLDSFDKVYIAKVFTDTFVPPDLPSNTVIGGTGFFYDRAEPLPYDIEHHFPDYHLYDDWVEDRLLKGDRAKNFAFYRDASIGYLTRGCFRHCSFCVNKNYGRISRSSELSEFLDKDRKKIVLLDDNFFGHPDWRKMLQELRDTGKPFQFRQGLDERLLDDEKCEILFSSKYDGEFIFAFDNIKDAAIIENKIKLARKHTLSVMRFYVLCGFDWDEKWDSAFWRQDLMDLFARIEILMRYRCLPYIMRFNRYQESPYREAYIAIARWCNQPGMFKKLSLREFAEKNGERSGCFKAVRNLEMNIPEARHYINLKFPEK